MRRSALIGLSLTVLAGLGVVLCVVSGDLASTVFFVSYGGAGAYLAARRSTNAIGWLLLATIGLQSLLSDVTQGETLAVAISTLAAFAVFQPVRRRVQTAVDRRFDRTRYDQQRTIDTFAGRIRDEVDLATLNLDLVATTDDAVRPVAAGVWLRPGTDPS